MAQETGNWFTQMMGANPINQDFTLSGTADAYGYANQLMTEGDPLAQRLLRENTMDAVPSLNTQLGVTAATGGNPAIARMLNMQGVNQAGNNIAQGIMAMRGQERQDALSWNRQGMAGQQYTHSQNYNQELENRAAKNALFNNIAGLGGNLLFGSGGIGSAFGDGGGIFGTVPNLGGTGFTDSWWSTRKKST